MIFCLILTSPWFVGKYIKLESSESCSLFPFGICELTSMVTTEQDYDKDALLAQLSGCTINLLGAKAPNNAVPVLPRGILYINRYHSDRSDCRVLIAINNGQKFSCPPIIL